MTGATLLSDTDPFPVRLQEPDSPSNILVVCDHAGNLIPIALHDRNVSSADLSTHIAIDISAYAVAVRLAENLNSTLVSQRYSRLVVDMNRPTSSNQLMPAQSDEVRIPFNQDLDDTERQARLDEIYMPYHNEIGRQLDKIGESAVLVAMHSFTPKLRNAPERIWHVDLMTRTHSALAGNLQQQLEIEFPDLQIGQGKVFQISDKTDFTVPFHGESRKIPNISIEVRNDLLQSESDIDRWASVLTRCIPESLASSWRAESQTA
ncbi:MAG: N-formylglutamate amidohydrolase [Acidiferrobacterales bacterium]|nr:N-formylglutamate amidohydrolase [Acidiferrobacterales bacterium]